MRNKKLHLQVEKANGFYKLKIRIPSELEDVFKKMGEGIEPKISSVWLNEQGQGVQFYSVSEEHRVADSNLSNCVFNNFGAGLLDGELINIAPLRTIGASKGVTITCNRWDTGSSNLDLDYYVRELALYCKTAWSKYVQKKKIKALITFDV